MRYDAAMALCPSCGAERAPAGAPCPRCGRDASPSESAVPDLELDIPVRRVAKAPAAQKQPEPELSLELAIDPRTLIQPIDPELSSSFPASSGVRTGAVATSNAPGNSLRPTSRSTGRVLAPRGQEGIGPAVHDLAFDARLLAEYGDPPRHWIASPLYAWRVLRRQRELKQAIVGRRAEAARTTVELGDALVAFAERVRPAAEREGTYATLLDNLKRAEEALRSRDRVLAADQDAQTARLASVDAQLLKLEAELVQSQAEERALLAEMGAAQGALSRAEAKVKRAETELRAAQRAPNRTSG